MKTKYDGIEIQGLKNIGDDACEPCFDEKPDFYGVYYHLIEGGVQWVSDHKTLPLALKKANKLANKTGFEIKNYAT